MDIFENIVLCKECGKRMTRATLERNGFLLRVLRCPGCTQTVYHPVDIARFKRFAALKEKSFRVKLRLVGNSYTVSIPREIINFFNELNQERYQDIYQDRQEQDKFKKSFDNLNRFVEIAFAEANRLLLSFEKGFKVGAAVGEEKGKQKGKKKGGKGEKGKKRIVKTRIRVK